MSLSGKTRLFGSGGPSVDHGLSPKAHGATTIAPGADSVHGSTDARPEHPAASIASSGARALRIYGVVTSRKEAILPQPDDALA
jgi:hypothetical protein